ncbi:MAG: fasciclin domain-containing protein [Sneathiella sp.]
MSRLLQNLSALLIVGVFAVACAKDDKMADKKMYAPKKDIVVTAIDAGQFTTLGAAVKAAGLGKILQGPDPSAVFAPTDKAFAKLPAGTVETLLKLENKVKLVAILTYHPLAGEVPSSAVAGKKFDPATVQGSTIIVDGTDGVMINGSAKVVAADIVASNGVIHDINL